MVQVKVSELQGSTLDWAVAKCEGLAVSDRATKWRSENCPHLYSTDWARGGPIIDREGLSLAFVSTHKLWVCSKGLKVRQNGQTPLVAAMRCRVASKLGDVVDVPDGLINN